MTVCVILALNISIAWFKPLNHFNSQLKKKLSLRACTITMKMDSGSLRSCTIYCVAIAAKVAAGIVCMGLKSQK